MSIADLIVEQLIRSGVSHVFGVGGANIEDLFAAIQRRRPAIAAVLTKHEHGAAAAAAAYARIKGGLGVVLATSGGGAMNLTHGLAEARASRVPLLAIVGEPPSDLQGHGAFQDTSGQGGAVDAAVVLGHAAGFAVRVEHADDTLRLLDRALAHIATQSSPAVLLIAKDRQAADAARRSERESLVPMPTLPQLPLGLLLAAARRLVGGGCVIVAGEEVTRARAGSELAQLAAALDARVAVTPDARDCFDNYDPRFLGVTGAMGHDRVVSALQGARQCLLVGTRLPLLARMGLEKRLLDMPLMSFGGEPAYISSGAHEHFACELRSGLRALIGAVREFRPRSVSAPEPAPAPNLGGEAFDSAAALRAIERAIEDDSVVLVDAGNTGASATHYLRAPRNGRWLIAMGMGGMGYAFGAAIGAACASSRRCWVFAGDGAFFMHGFEIHTAVEHALPITYVIFDNRAHGMCLVRERLLLHQDGGYNSFRRSRLAAGLAEMFPGLYARECSNLAQLESALNELPSVEGPRVITLRLEEVEVPPFVAFQQADPGARTVPRGGGDEGE